MSSVWDKSYLWPREKTGERLGAAVALATERASLRAAPIAVRATTIELPMKAYAQPSEETARRKSAESVVQQSTGVHEKQAEQADLFAIIANDYAALYAGELDGFRACTSPEVWDATEGTARLGTNSAEFIFLFGEKSRIVRNNLTGNAECIVLGGRGAFFMNARSGRFRAFRADFPGFVGSDRTEQGSIPLATRKTGDFMPEWAKRIDRIQTGEPAPKRGLEAEAQAGSDLNRWRLVWG